MLEKQLVARLAAKVCIRIISTMMAVPMLIDNSLLSFQAKTDLPSVLRKSLRDSLSWFDIDRNGSIEKAELFKIIKDQVSAEPDLIDALCARYIPPGQPVVPIDTAVTRMFAIAQVIRA